MSYRRRHRWFRRMALGLAFASVLVAGRASVAAAKFDEGTSGSRYVAAGGWSGLVDMESGIPLSAGIPEGDEQFIDEQAAQVIPYLSHGMLTPEDAQAAAAQAIHDPYVTEVFVRPDGDAIAMRNALVTQTLAAAEAIHDPYTGETLGGLDGEELAFANAVVAAADSLHDPLTAQEQSTASPEKFIPGVTDFPTSSQPAPDNRVERGLEQGPQVIPYLSQGMTADDVVGARPDDKADRFAHSDVATPLEVSNSGSTFEWNDALTVGIGALVLALGLGLALGYLRRPRLAGL